MPGIERVYPIVAFDDHDDALAYGDKLGMRDIVAFPIRHPDDERFETAGDQIFDPLHIHTPPMLCNAVAVKDAESLFLGAIARLFSGCRLASAVRVWRLDFGRTTGTGDAGRRDGGRILTGRSEFGLPGRCKIGRSQRRQANFRRE